MLKNGSKKGFSLFTPLVGTAIVVITIMIVSTMIQNDVRFSRSITSSYVVSSQTTVSRAISADILSLLNRKMNERIESSLSPGPSAPSFSSESDCNDFFIDWMEGGDLEKTLNAQEVYDFFIGMKDLISINEELTGYKFLKLGKSCDSDIVDCINELANKIQGDSGADLFKTYFSDEDKLVFELNSENKYKIDFAITLLNQYTQDSVTLPLIVGNTKSQTDLPVKQAIEVTCKNFGRALNGQGMDTDIEDVETNFEGTDGEIKIDANDKKTVIMNWHLYARKTGSQLRLVAKQK